MLLFANKDGLSLPSHHSCGQPDGLISGSLAAFRHKLRGGEGLRSDRPTAALAGFTQRTGSSRTSLKNIEYLNKHRSGAGCDLRAADRNTGRAEALACSQEDEGEPEDRRLAPGLIHHYSHGQSAEDTTNTNRRAELRENNEPTDQPLDPGECGNELCTSAQVSSQGSKDCAPVVLTFNGKRCLCICLNTTGA